MPNENNGVPNSPNSWSAYAKYVVNELDRLDRWCRDNLTDIGKVRNEMVEEAKSLRKERTDAIEKTHQAISDLKVEFSSLRSKIVGAVAIAVIVIEIAAKLIGKINL